MSSAVPHKEEEAAVDASILNEADPPTRKSVCVTWRGGVGALATCPSKCAREKLSLRLNVHNYPAIFSTPAGFGCETEDSQYCLGRSLQALIEIRAADFDLDGQVVGDD